MYVGDMDIVRYSKIILVLFIEIRIEKGRLIF